MARCAALCSAHLPLPIGLLYSSFAIAVLVCGTLSPLIKVHCWGFDQTALMSLVCSIVMASFKLVCPFVHRSPLPHAVLLCWSAGGLQILCQDFCAPRALHRLCVHKVYAHVSIRALHAAVCWASCQ
jgi:hypothetical protein